MRQESLACACWVGLGNNQILKYVQGFAQDGILLPRIKAGWRLSEPAF